MAEFRDRDRRLYLRNFRGSALFALATVTAFFMVFFRVIANVLNGSLTVGDVALFGGATARLRFSLTGEGGLNDGAAFPFVMLGLGLLGLHDLGTGGWRWIAVDVLWAITGGLAIGATSGQRPCSVWTATPAVPG